MNDQKKSKMATVSEDEAGLRLDRWFKRNFATLTHGNLQKLLRTGQIRVDGKRAESSDRIQAGQIIRLPPQLINFEDNNSDASLGSKPMRHANKLRDMILYEDDDVIALNKPAGLAVQGGTGLKENLDDTLMALSIDGKTKPKLVHRLDRDTSGVLLIARTDYAAAKLAESFRDRETQKIYWAITIGTPKPMKGRIDAPLLKRGETMVVVSGKEESKSAVTVYKVIQSAKKFTSFVALWPVTGRTHQLRAHMEYIGTPILGDRLYGGENPAAMPIEELGAGLHLHARRLIIPHPRRGLINVTAPLSRSMQKTWNWFQFNDQAEVDFGSL